jgi:hypothetical protein
VISTRRLGLSFTGALIALGGAATAWRTTYIAVPGWRRSIAIGAIVLGVVMIIGSFRHERSK